MKVCIVTFCDNGNYGSELQAIAMNIFLVERNHEAIFVKLKSQNKILRLFEIVGEKAKDKLWYIKDQEYRNMRTSLKHNQKKNLEITRELKSTIHRYVKNKIFIKKISKINNNDLFDCYICGSDQIWSPAYIPFNKNLFLGDVNSNKKIAYAPSFGLNKIPIYHLEKSIPMIKSFKYLSIREQSGADVIKKHANIDAKVVCDPTMLLTNKQWEDILKESPNTQISDDYVFCYFLGEISEGVKKIIKDYSKEKKIIMLPYLNNIDSKYGFEYVESNPAEFLNLIKNANHIFTDSFHGTVFSIIFQKDFTSFKRNYDSKLNQTSRILSLLKILNIEKCFCDTLESIQIEKNIDYNVINTRINSFREESINFLENALKNIEVEYEK